MRFDWFGNQARLRSGVDKEWGWFQVRDDLRTVVAPHDMQTQVDAGWASR
jgi:hypothetical protein